MVWKGAVHVSSNFAVQNTTKSSLEKQSMLPAIRGSKASPSAPAIHDDYVPPLSSTEEGFYALVDPPTSPAKLCYLTVTAVGGLLSLLLAASSLSCCLLTDMCPYYTGVWVSSICLANAVLGMLALLWNHYRRNLYVAHLALSVLAFAACMVLLVLSTINWMTVGAGRPNQNDPNFYKRTAQSASQLRYQSKLPPIVSGGVHDQATDQPADRFCLIAQYDADRISYVYQYQNGFDFEGCLQQVKLAITFNTLAIAIALYLSISSVCSVAVCSWQLGSCVKKRRRLDSI